MNNEKEIEEMAKVIQTAQQPIEYDENTYSVTVYPTERDIANALIDVGYGNVKQAVQEFAEALKKKAKLLYEPNREWYENVRVNEIDDLIAELYGAEE